MAWFSEAYMFVVVNFDALAQASDFRSERRQAVFLCWMQEVWDTKWLADWMPTHKPTELLRIKQNLSEHSAHLSSLPIGFHTWLWWHTCLLLMFWHRQAIFKPVQLSVYKADWHDSWPEIRDDHDRFQKSQPNEASLQTQHGLIYPAWNM